MKFIRILDVFVMAGTIATFSPSTIRAEALLWSHWSVHDASADEFVLGNSMVFQRTKGETDPYLSRQIAYGKHHFTFKVRYRTDEHLSPTVLLYLPATVDIRPLAVFRLPVGSEWREFEADFVGHDTKDAVVELRIYPGTMEPNRMKKGGLTPLGHNPGRVEFAAVSWEQTSTPVASLSKGPQPFSTTKATFKRAGDVDLKVHIDHPAKPNSNVAVIWFHGGGFVGGTPDSSLSQATYLATRGIICVRPQYRLVNQGGNADVTLQDAADAVEWVKRHGAEHGLEPTKFVIAGTSAGAVLGAVLAQRVPECLGFIGLAGYYDAVTTGDSAVIDHATPFFKGGTETGVMRRISAIHQIGLRPPPAFLIHGELDSTIDYRQSIAFADALKRVGGDVELVILPWLNHVPNLVADDVFHRVEQFIGKLQASRNGD